MTEQSNLYKYNKERNVLAHRNRKSSTFIWNLGMFKPRSTSSIKMSKVELEVKQGGGIEGSTNCHSSPQQRYQFNNYPYQKHLHKD